MLDFFRCLVAAKVPGLGQKDLLALLVNPVLQQQGVAIHKQVMFALVFVVPSSSKNALPKLR